MTTDTTKADNVRLTFTHLNHFWSDETMSKVLKYVGPAFNGDGTETVGHKQHQRAINGHTNDAGRALMMLLNSWEQYATSHQSRYESSIGDDYVLGPYWAETGLAIKRLLDGETGGLDCGSIAANITDIIQDAGFETDGYSLTGKDDDRE